MKRHAWAVLGLGLWAVGGGGVGSAWGQEQRPPPSIELKQNYPNPFNPATTIPFVLGGELWASGRQPVVSLRIYNVLGQLVAIPILQGTGQKLDNVVLECADAVACTFAAYWDGNVIGTQREAASGVYLYQLVVDGRRFTRKMLILK
jgi:hypothetical protein